MTSIWRHPWSFKKTDDYIRIRILNYRCWISRKKMQVFVDRTAAQRKWRKRVKTALVEKNDNCCEICGNRYSREGLTMHHIKPKWKYPELEYVAENIMLLCHACHAEIHEGETSKYKLYKLSKQSELSEKQV